MAGGIAKAGASKVAKVAAAAAKSRAPKAPAAAAAATKAKPKAKASKPSAAPAEPKKPNGLTSPVPLSAASRKFFGVSEMSRVDATRALWVYIKSHNLQDPAAKRLINVDDKLKALLNCEDKIEMTKLPGLMSPHFNKKANP